ncbi:steroid 17alpha-monooxygenase or 17alpha-hydroxyprogesterone aldolase [Spatholobus suberectus]|nr:steroid 17alpha-monooxygenase or 17alpha-hydroxyprogesterone aldolase [Spatholobus suberectus]
MGVIGFNIVGSRQQISGKDVIMEQMGQRPTPSLVVSSAEVAREIVKTHDQAFSDRAQSTAAKIFFYECTAIGFGRYGEDWRQKRKICVQQFLSSKMVESFRVIRGEEVAELVNKLREVSSSDARNVNLKEMFMSTPMNMVYKGVFGRKYSEHNYSKVKESVRKVMVHLGAFTLRDHFPLLGWVDVLTGKIREYKATFEVLDAALDHEITEQLTAKTHSEKKDFVDVLLQHQEDSKQNFELTKNNIKGIILTISSVKLKGYDIPAKTVVYTNAWAIQRDPEYWESPEEFLPERFENSQFDFKGQEDFQFIPFGFGRRGCPGMNFAMAAIENILASLLYWFDWKLPENDAQDIDMSETFAFVTSKKVPLDLKPKTFSF